MRGGSVLATATAAAFAGVLCCGAWAGPATSTSPNFILFSGVDLWRNGNFLYGGANWSPGGIDNDGFTLRVLLWGGSSQYVADSLNAVVKDRQYGLHLMPGWKLTFGQKTELKVFAGLDTQYHGLRPDDPGASLRGSQTGVRASFELWTEPTPQTMFKAYGGVTTIATNFDLYVATGIRLCQSFYLGPEIQASKSWDYTQYRIGAHVTAVQIGRFEAGASAGFARDSDGTSGPYARLSVSTKR